MDERILLAVDESPASTKAQDYLTGMLAGRAGDYVHVVHVLPPLPSAATLSEIAPGSPGKIDARLKQQREQARHILEAARERMVSAGVAAERVDVGYLNLTPTMSVAEGMLDVARENNCSTIVVGRNSLPWYKELFHGHPADELVRKAHEVTLWIVE